MAASLIFTCWHQGWILLPATLHLPMPLSCFYPVMTQLLCDSIHIKAAPSFQLCALPCKSLHRNKHPGCCSPSSKSSDTLTLEMCSCRCGHHQHLCLTALPLPTLTIMDGAQSLGWEVLGEQRLSGVLCPSVDSGDFSHCAIQAGLFAPSSEAPQTAPKIVLSCSVAFQAKPHSPMWQKWVWSGRGQWGAHCPVSSSKPRMPPGMGHWKSTEGQERKAISWWRQSSGSDCPLALSEVWTGWTQCLQSHITQHCFVWRKEMLQSPSTFISKWRGCRAEHSTGAFLHPVLHMLESSWRFKLQQTDFFCIIRQHVQQLHSLQEAVMVSLNTQAGG